MWLMARKATHRGLHFAGIRWIKQVRDRVPVHGMSHAEFQWQDHDLILGEIVFRKLHAAIEDGHHVLGFQFFRLPIWTVAFQADRVRCRSAQQVIVVSAVRLVAGGATLGKSRLVVIRLLRQFGNIAVAAQTDVDRVSFRQARLVAGVWAMAVGAIARRSRMLHLRGFDQLGFIVVAGHAERLDVGLRQHYFSILGRRVADFALLVGEWRMGEFCH